MGLDTALSELPARPSPQTHERAGFHSGFAPAEDSMRWLQVDLGESQTLDAVVVVPASRGGSEAYGFPSRFRVDVSEDASFAESTLLLNHTERDAPSALAPWYVEARAVRARYVRFTATKLSPQPGLGSRFMFCLGELLVFSGGRNVALQSKVEAPRSVETLPTWSPRHLVDGTYALGLPVIPGKTRTNGWHSGISTEQDTVKWVQLELASPSPVHELRIIPAHPSDYPDRLGFGFPLRFKVEADETVIFDSTASDFPNPGSTPVAFPLPGLVAKTFRITATRLWERSSDYAFALAEVQLLLRGQNLAAGSRVTCLDETLTTHWRPEFLVDGQASNGLLIPEVEWLRGLSVRRQLEQEGAALLVAMGAARELAQRRAAWLTLGVTLVMLGGLLVWVWRVQHLRQLEMNALRDRLARDLHDEIGSHLGSIRLMSELSLREGCNDECLQEIHRLAGEAAESMRDIIWLVREGDAPALMSLAEAVRQSAGSLLKGKDWSLNVERLDADQTAPLRLHRQVLLFFRETAHNIARHAGATRVEIVMMCRAGRLVLQIEDNGRGFDVEKVEGGHGLSNLRHRAECLSGELWLESRPGDGTRIILEVPLE